jgi:hypothetical protein
MGAAFGPKDPGLLIEQVGARMGPERTVRTP